MPKMKTHSGAKKRFKLTGTGKVRGRHAFSTHILEKKREGRLIHAQLRIDWLAGLLCMGCSGRLGDAGELSCAEWLAGGLVRAAELALRSASHWTQVCSC